MAAPQTADAHRLAALSSPDNERPVGELNSPMKVPAKPGFVPLSPGPEKAKLHMDAVASLLGLSSAEAQKLAEEKPDIKPTTKAEPALDQWTILPSTTAGHPLRAAKRLTPSEIYSRAIVIPRQIFESLFGRQTSNTTTALVESSAGSLLALAAEVTAGGAQFSLRAGPLVNAMRAAAGNVLVLTAVDSQAVAAGTPLRARASLGYPSDVPSANGTVGPESRSASGSPGSLDSLTQLSDGEGTEDDPGAASLPDGDQADLDNDLAGDLTAGDPEWQQGGTTPAANGGSAPRTRGRPRKRKPFATAGITSQRSSTASANLSCCHCGTRETPRWWKDAFPLGTLCNACGIWLKRHGYPRPVQFFSVPSATPNVAGISPRAPPQGPAPGDFYLINGRPKRRRAAVNSTYGRGMDDEAIAAAMAAAAAASSPVEMGINYQAAGGRVFVMRRKLITTEATGTVSAALVHFGWAPGSRAAHEMFDKVSGYSGNHPEGTPVVTVEDFELLGDTKATATLTLRNDAEVPEDWNALVRHFVDSL